MGEDCWPGLVCESGLTLTPTCPRAVATQPQWERALPCSPAHGPEPGQPARMGPSPPPRPTSTHTPGMQTPQPATGPTSATQVTSPCHPHCWGSTPVPSHPSGLGAPQEATLTPGRAWHLLRATAWLPFALACAQGCRRAGARVGST